jgi:transcriptional regulator with XRE-family HTH domain
LEEIIVARSADRKRAPHPRDLALGLRIREQRKSIGMTQAGLANAVGMTFQQVQKYERAFTRVSFSRLVSIAHALGCKVADLIAGLDEQDTGQPIFQHKAAHLRVRGAADLLAGYAQLAPRQRQAVLNLMVELASNAQSREKSAAPIPVRFPVVEAESRAPCP